METSAQIPYDKIIQNILDDLDVSFHKTWYLVESYNLRLKQDLTNTTYTFCTTNNWFSFNILQIPDFKIKTPDMEKIRIKIIELISFKESFEKEDKNKELIKQLKVLFPKAFIGNC